MGNPLSYLHDQLEQWRADGSYQRLRVLESASAAESRFDGKDVVNLASNNYLGLTTHPKLREAAIEATRKYGVGSGAADSCRANKISRGVFMIHSPQPISGGLSWHSAFGISRSPALCP